MKSDDETGGDFWRLLAMLGDDVRFTGSTGLGFPRTDAELLPTPLGQRPTMETTFLGLGGVDSPLPNYLLDALADPAAAVEGTPLLALLDVLHERLIRQFLDVSTAFELSGGHSRDPARGLEADAWVDRLLSVCGLSDRTNAANAMAGAWRVLRLAPILASGWRSAWALEAALRDWVEPGLPYGARLDVVEFAGSWSLVHPESRNALGMRNAGLGTHVTLGDSVPDVAGRLRLQVGEVPDAYLRRFESGGDLGRLVDAAVALLVDEPLGVELQLTVVEKAANPAQLGGPARQHLGRSAWLGGHDARRRVFRRSVPGDRRGQGGEWTPVGSP